MHSMHTAPAASPIMMHRMPSGTTIPMGNWHNAGNAHIDTPPHTKATHNENAINRSAMVIYSSSLGAAISLNLAITAGVSGFSYSTQPHAMRSI